MKDSKKYIVRIVGTSIAGLPIDMLKEYGNDFYLMPTLNEGELDMLPQDEMDKLMGVWSSINPSEPLLRYVRTIARSISEYNIQNDGSSFNMMDYIKHIGKDGDTGILFYDKLENRFKIRNERTFKEIEYSRMRREWMKQEKEN